MRKHKGKFLVKGSSSPPKRFRYKVLDHIKDFDKSCTCIITKTLNPDYYLLFNHIDLIITEKGSALSHLSIVAMEYGLPVLLAEDIILKIPKKGSLSIEDNTITDVSAE